MSQQRITNSIQRLFEIDKLVRNQMCAVPLGSKTRTNFGIRELAQTLVF